MALPILEQIAAAVVTRLEGITTHNGYEFDVDGVDRVNRDPDTWTPKHHAIAVVQLDSEENDEHSCEGNPPKIAYTTVFLCHCFVRLSDQSNQGEDAKENNQAVAAMTKVIRSATRWFSWGGLARISTLTTAAPFVSEDGSHSGGVVRLEVIHRTPENDPFTAI